MRLNARSSISLAFAVALLPGCAQSPPIEHPRLPFEVPTDEATDEPEKPKKKAKKADPMGAISKAIDTVASKETAKAAKQAAKTVARKARKAEKAVTEVIGEAKTAFDAVFAAKPSKKVAKK